MNLFTFTHAPKQNSTPGFDYLPGRAKLSIPPKQCFLKILFPEQKEQNVAPFLHSVICPEMNTASITKKMTAVKGNE